MTEETQEPKVSGSSSSVTCSALTASGKQCRAVPMPGQAFCLFHSQQAEAKRIMADTRGGPVGWHDGLPQADGIGGESGVGGGVQGDLPTSLAAYARWAAGSAPL